MTDEWQKVSKEEFDRVVNFIKGNPPSKLESGVMTICEPPFWYLKQETGSFDGPWFAKREHDDVVTYYLTDTAIRLVNRKPGANRKKNIERRRRRNRKGRGNRKGGNNGAFGKRS